MGVSPALKRTTPVRERKLRDNMKQDGREVEDGDRSDAPLHSGSRVPGHQEATARAGWAAVVALSGTFLLGARRGDALHPRSIK